MISLFVQYYLSGNESRQSEIDCCIQKNSSNKFIDRIVFIITPDGSRPTYNDFFKKISEVSGPEDVNIIANSDIYFDETILLAKKVKDGEVYILTRWSVSDSSISFDGDYDPKSQDVWIFKGVPRNVDGNICLGIPGCDCRIAYEFKKAGMSVLNVGRSIISRHLHQVEYRSWKALDYFYYQELGWYTPKIEPSDFFNRIYK
jgi:hypothetical protein